MSTHGTHTVELVSVEQGAGPVVVLLHGLGGSTAFWQRTAGHLAMSHRVVALDLRGHGSSPLAPDADYSVDAFAGDVLYTLDSLGVRDFVLIGHSFGATVGMAVAAQAADRVRGLVLLDAAGAFSDAPPGALEQFLSMVAGPDGMDVLRDTFADTLTRATDATRQQVLDSVDLTSHAALAGAYRSLLAYVPSPVLAGYPGPVLLVVDAENDSTFSLHAQEPLRPRRSVADTSHWIMLDQPDAVHAYLDDFLTILSAS